MDLAEQLTRRTVALTTAAVAADAARKARLCMFLPPIWLRNYTADDRETWLPTMRHIALEGRCFVLTACQVVRRRDFPADYRCVTGDDPNAMLMRGGAAIIDPLGNVLAGPVFGEETLLAVNLDLDTLARAKLDFDVTGHYARPDVFSLSVNEAPQPAVTLKNSIPR
jgi:nitrilase